MRDFLSSINVGVFDLQDVMEQGPSAIVPDFLKDPIRSSEKLERKLEKEIDKISKLHQQSIKKGNDRKREIYEEIKENLTGKLETQRTETERAKIDREINRQSLSGLATNLYQSRGGKLGIGIAGAVVRSISKTFSNITQQVDETGFLSDRLLEDFERIAQASHETLESNEKLYNTVDNNFDTFIGLRREFGHIENFSIKTLDNITQLEDIIGLSADEATDLLSTFKGINRESIQTNTTMVKTFSLLANEEGVAFRDVMQDITDNAEFFATYMSTSSEDMSSLIIKAQKLGTSFSDFTQVFESFSDIESTIEKQARMSIFAGQRFDFLSVLEQLQQGNVGQAQTNIMGQLGGINEGKFDNPFVKRQLAEGFGVDAQTLNKLFKASQNQLSQQQIIQRDFTNQLENFNDQFKQLGFSTIQKAFTQYVLNPLNQFLSTEKDRAQALFDGIADILEGVGFVTTNLMKFTASIQQTMQKALGDIGGLITSIGMVGGALASIKSLGDAFSTSTMLQTQQVNLLTQIRNYLGAQTASSGGGNTFMGGGKLGKGVAGLMGLGTLIGAGTMGASGDFSWGELATAVGTNAGSGALIGSISPDPITTGIGAGVGAVAGGLTYFGSDAVANNNSTTVKQNRGGIFTKRYTGKMDVAETGKPEGFVPLETQDGKPTMPADLSDRTIKKLAGAMSKMKFVGEVKVDGKKQSIEFYNHAMNPSSALNV